MEMWALTLYFPAALFPQLFSASLPGGLINCINSGSICSAGYEEPTWGHGRDGDEQCGELCVCTSSHLDAVTIGGFEYPSTWSV